MAAAAFTVSLCVLLLSAVSGLQSDDRECAFTDLQGAEPYSGADHAVRGEVRDNGTVRCSRGSRCYGVWEKRGDGRMQLVKQGCWIHVGDEQECLGDRCLVTATPSQIQNGSYRFCCCSRDLCNADFTEAPPTPDTPALRLMKGDGTQTDQQQLKREETALVALVTVAITAVLIIALFLGYRMMRGKHKPSLSALDVMETANTDSSVNLDNLKLLELIGRGRYGAVFRGDLSGRCVAVKLFSATNRQNFTNECLIYSLPLLEHDNIARFLTADHRSTEPLIVMENYPHGSLCQYLSLHTVDWWTCLRMCLGVTRGLSFLHTELCRADQYKPAVAHRDVTSRNILVRSDLTCVLADFGLSMKLPGTRSSRHGDDDTMAISEVGTVRYMAPEVLGGALNLRDCESALKQVDVYALALIYWESFRRCRDLFPGESVPEFQLAFQVEVGNHPSFEEMQILVLREKHRPKFPEVWKENSSLLHSLKETMEDCWDQDAEARLSAQCAEERLCDLLTAHTHNHRNLSHGRWSPQVGSSSPYIEDVQVGVVRNLQSDASAVVRTTSEGSEKNTNSINYERQQAKSQARSSTSDGGASNRAAMTPASLITICESEHSGAVSSVPVCLQLTEEDLGTTKLDLKQVDKNLRENSDEILMKLSQKHFSSQPQTTLLSQHALLLTDEVNSSISAPHRDLGGAGPTETPPTPCSAHPLRKQQNLPVRPSSLQLVLKDKDKSHRQVETGVAKMNTLTVIAAAAPHVVTAVNYNTGNNAHCTTVSARSYSAGAPTLVTNGMTDGGRTNPAGPQLDEEETPTKDGGRVNFNFSPDEHEPLLRSPELRPHRQPRAGNILSGRGSNSNNNNNRGAMGSEVTVKVLVPEQMLNSSRSQTPEAPVVHVPEVLGSESTKAPEKLRPDASGAQELQDVLEPSLTQEGPAARAPALDPEASDPEASDPEASDPAASAPEAPVPEASDPEASVPKASSQRDPHPEDPAPQPEGSETSISEEAAVRVEPRRTRRPERPCSLDLSSCCLPSDGDSLSSSGEKIKRRVKTPYTLKKWRPASWVVSTETTLDPDFEFDVNLPNIVQSKSSMAVFLVGGGAKATSDPDVMTCF
ncbi:bone morphogenetic protein receptor type-2-like [Solea senegalensis]|uniref:Bone morphogenetic protein receptor type-2-like n=1 Tax=Solea senegalensis TaxID=28829 RepID=A0AAV6RBH6_SOLSE|nr:bone morphogenetic protein receptor type-2-like [Solea senegalensis]KAG7502400.1 bone morphogenetic protein receptor type-2-like [Solea senegalensis]